MIKGARVFAYNPLHGVKGVALSARIPRSLRSLPPSQAKGAEYERGLFGETSPATCVQSREDRP
jgi:hypothetical protein